MNAIDRAQAIRDYRHYRRLLTSKRLQRPDYVKIAGMADALATRWNLTTTRWTI